MSRPLKTGFNTQPPEGGWIRARWIRPFWRGFNTQPPEGGWVQVCRLMVQSNGFNTQPPEGGWYRWLAHTMMSVRFQHTAARRRLGLFDFIGCVDNGFQHTAARRRLVKDLKCRSFGLSFQHTAARRRLAQSTQTNPHRMRFNTQPPEGGWLAVECAQSFVDAVSTHSRPKAAGTGRRARFLPKAGFNTQPPEGGWMREKRVEWELDWFQHTAARRRLVFTKSVKKLLTGFNTQPPEGGWHDP